MRQVYSRSYWMNITVLTYDTLDSTNTEALRQARQGADEGLCIVSRQQTAGRGRRGRTWVSVKDAGLYFSIILRPKIEPEFLPLITLMTGVAVHDTLGELGIDADIKWVNDILVGEKKISGILAETADTDKGLAVVVGIGINMRSTNYPSDIAAPATSIETVSGNAPTPDELIDRLTLHLAAFYERLKGPAGPDAIVAEWQKRSSYAFEKLVRVSIGNELIEGVTDGLEPNGALRVIRHDGRLAMISAGDVEMLRTAVALPPGPN